MVTVNEGEIVPREHQTPGYAVADTRYIVDDKNPALVNYRLPFLSHGCPRPLWAGKGKQAILQKEYWEVIV